jgi:hypothetical protein
VCGSEAWGVGDDANEATGAGSGSGTTAVGSTGVSVGMSDPTVGISTGTGGRSTTGGVSTLREAGSGVGSLTGSVKVGGSAASGSSITGAIGLSGVALGSGAILGASLLCPITWPGVAARVGADGSECTFVSGSGIVAKLVSGVLSGVASGGETVGATGLAGVGTVGSGKGEEGVVGSIKNLFPYRSYT